MTPIDTPSVAPEPLDARATERFAALAPALIERLVRTAVRSVAARELPDDDSRMIAAHVTVARLAGSHMARIDRSALLHAPSAAAESGPAERALAEHLHARLEPEELLVASLCAARSVPVKQAATALNLDRDELQDLLESALGKAAELTLAYHDEQICEPAALSSAANPAAAAAAVSEHLRGCRSCHAEFEQRVWLVVSQAGAIVPLPPLCAGNPGRRGAMRLRARRTRPALLPAHEQAA
jgi:hypothetical protein